MKVETVLASLEKRLLIKFEGKNSDGFEGSEKTSS